MGIPQKMKASWSKLVGSRTGQDMVHPGDILVALKKAAEREKKFFKEKTFVPERYTVRMCPQDLSGLRPILDALKGELVEEMNAYLRQKGLRVNSPGVIVEFDERLLMKPGALEIDARFERRSGSADRHPQRRDDAQAGAPDLNIRLLISPGTPEEATILLKQGAHVLGRGRAADVVVTATDSLVSKTHCCLEFQQGDVSVRDLQSANGTLLNGERIAEPKRLESGDRLLLGNTEIRVVW